GGAERGGRAGGAGGRAGGGGRPGPHPPGGRRAPAGQEPGTDMSAKAHEGYEIAGANEPLHTRFAEPLPRIPLVWGPTDFEKLSEQIGEITEKGQPLWW